SSTASRLLGRCRFPAPGTSVTCAVSGGADSLALLVLAREAGCQVTAVHVDHCLRPGSDSEAGVVRAAASRFGAAFIAVRAPVSAGPNLEARAREARYAVLPPDALTGHTADDQAETVLLNLMWGAGLDGLAAMDPERHPLLRLRRRETRALCDELGLVPVEDPTNADRAFRRNRVRHALPAARRHRRARRRRGGGPSGRAGGRRGPAARPAGECDRPHGCCCPGSCA